MTASCHERHRDALLALAGDAAILPSVLQAGTRSDWWSAERTWRRIYGRFMPDSPAFASLAFASDIPTQEICRIEVFQRPPQDAGRIRDACDVETPVGWARLTRFPYDPDLPGLRTVAAGATVVRYHPGRRCTLRTAHRDRTVFAKVYATDTGARVFRDLATLHGAALRDGLPLSIAEPISWDPSTRTLCQAALPGCPAVEGLRGPAGDELARRIGVAAASLTRATVSSAAILDGTAVLARSRRHAADLVHRVPGLARDISAIVDRLSNVHARYPSRHLRPVHGAPHPDQWLDAGSAIGLIDFDRFGLGDPELDAGIALAGLNALDSPALPPFRLAAALLEGYNAAGVALCAPLLRAYRAHQHLAKALRAAQALRPDGDRRAEKHAAAAARLLTEAVPA